MKTSLHTSKKVLYALNLFLLFFISHLFAQNPTWQWGKKGGTTDNITDFNNWEQVRAIETDANGNVYILAPVGINNLMIDGNPKPTYGLYAGDGSASLDYVIASFSCDGTYRWSKVIGGQETDQVQNIQLDAEGNVYAVGGIKNNNDDFSFPGLYPQVHFDTDVVLPYAEDNAYNQRLFIIKYNSEGVFQWLKMPQAADCTLIQAINAKSIDLQVDGLGNCFWLCKLGEGSYFNNELIVPIPSFYMLNLNSSGDFQNANLLDFQVGPVSQLDFIFRRNFATNTNYLSAFLYKSTNPPQAFIAAGQSMDYTRFVLAFDNQNSNIWARQNNTMKTWGAGTFNIDIDMQNNIYLNGKAGRIDFDSNSPMESFNGILFPEPLAGSQTVRPYITKLDSNGNTIWQTSAQYADFLIYLLGLKVNETKNEVALVGSQRGLQWDNFSIQQAASHGYDPYVVRLNKDTGAVVGMETFTSDDNTSDYATAITADNLGNYFVGGMFWSQVNIGGTVLQNTGAQTDFFIAKLGTSNCALNVEKTFFKDLKTFPNPVKDLLHIDNQEVIKYQLFNSLGMQIQSNTLRIGGTIDCSNLSAGFYILNLENHSGEKKVVKVLKE